MMSQEEMEKMKSIVLELLQKMAIGDFEVDLKFDDNNFVELDIKLSEPQILIGQNGQTLFEIQNLLKRIFSKKLNRIFYFSLDINDYKKKKTEYLKNLAKESADDVSLSQKNKVLSPMPAYERRIIHIELSERKDVIVESQGEGAERRVVIKPAAKTAE